MATVKSKAKTADCAISWQVESLAVVMMITASFPEMALTAAFVVRGEQHDPSSSFLPVGPCPHSGERLFLLVAHHLALVAGDA